MLVYLLLFVSFPPFSNRVSGGNSFDGCYKLPSCSNYSSSYDPETGFTNITGWLPSYTNEIGSSNGGECCQICHDINKIVCFNESDESCKSKTGYGDYDFLLFDQIWLPQLCGAFNSDHDPTLTHLNNSRCDPDTVQSVSSLSIHGLWPNYYNGFPQCCSASDTVAKLSPDEVVTWSFYNDLKMQWVDPSTQTSTDCAICYNLNHEWEKHGSCFSPESAQKYFETGLLINKRLGFINEKVNSFIGQNVSINDIKALYNPYIVNVLCDPKDPSQTSAFGIFLEIQTCWKRLDNNTESLKVNDIHSFRMIDCVPAAPMEFTTPCPEMIYMRSGLNKNELL
jgi:ribonuclease T2